MKLEPSQRPNSGRLRGQQDATLCANGQGELALTPAKDGPIAVGKGGDGRYHAVVGNLDVAFTAEQVLRLDILAGKNPVTAAANMDLPLKVNGQFMVPANLAQSQGPQRIHAPGEKDSYVPTGERPTGVQAPWSAPTLANAPAKDVTQSLRPGSNWDSAGVPAPSQTMPQGVLMGTKECDIFFEAAGKATPVHITLEQVWRKVAAPHLQAARAHGLVPVDGVDP